MRRPPHAANRVAGSTTDRAGILDEALTAPAVSVMIPVPRIARGVHVGQDHR